MKLNKSQRSNLIFFGIIAILFFTPIGGAIKEYSARLLSFAPSVVDMEDRVEVSSYNWNLKGLNTADYNFESAKGKVVFINFWATWCPPCRAEMPDIQSVYDDYKDKVEFILITNEASEKVTSYLEKNNYNLPSYNQYIQGPKEFQVSSIPATYVLSKSGEIVIHKVGPADWDSQKFRAVLDDLLSD